MSAPIPYSTCIGVAMDGRVESTNRNHVTVNASNELEAAATSVRACTTTDKKHVVQL